MAINREYIFGQANTDAVPKYMDQAGYVEDLKKALDEKWLNELISAYNEHRTTLATISLEFKQLLIKYAGFVSKQYLIKCAGIADRENLQRALLIDLLITEYVIKINLSNLESQFSALKFDSSIRGKSLAEDKNPQEKYPHRVVNIYKILQEKKDLEEKKDKSFDPRDPVTSYPTPTKKAVGILREAADALNHPNNHYRFWTRSPATEQFYIKAIDDIAYVDSSILESIRDFIEFKIGKLKDYDHGVKGGPFQLGWLHKRFGIGGVWVDGVKVPTRVREIYYEINYTLQDWGSEDENIKIRQEAIRNIVKWASEAIVNGKGSQTVETRKFYHDVLTSLVEKKPMIILDREVRAANHHKEQK